MLAGSRGGLAEDRLITGAPQSRGAAAAASHGVWDGPALRTGWHLQETLNASRGSSRKSVMGLEARHFRPLPPAFTGVSAQSSLTSRPSGLG